MKLFGAFGGQHTHQFSPTGAKAGIVWLLSFLFSLSFFLFPGCSAIKHVPDGQLLLDRVAITVDDSSKVATDELYNYLRQMPNHKVLGFLKLQLGIYNLSGKDSTKRMNRWLQKIGQEPVIYDQALTDQSAHQLKLALVNRGYNDVEVGVDTVMNKPKRVAVNYHLRPGKAHFIQSISYDIPDPGIRELVLTDSLLLPVKVGDHLDRDILDTQRTVIAEKLRNKGFYAFTKDYITFTADTTLGTKGVDLTMTLHNPKEATGLPQGGVLNPLYEGESDGRHQEYRFNNVYIVPDFNPGDNSANLTFSARDTITYKDIRILYGRDRYLTPKALVEQCFVRPGALFSPTAIDRTYEGYNRLAILRYVNIVSRPVVNAQGRDAIDVFILLSRTKKQGIMAELEGTNSEGDLGVGGGLTYTNRNLGHGGQVFTAKVRGAYESLSGNFEGLINHRYTEIGGELGLTFPRFVAPFLKSSFKHRVRATSEISATFMHQERPEYTRILAGAAWRYKWSDRANLSRRAFDLVDISLVTLPRSTIDFIEHVAPNNPLLRYSYEDHLIMRMGYTWLRTNRQPAAALSTRIREPLRDIYSIRLAVETAGNFLWALSSIDGAKRSDGAYKVFGVQFAQYVKGEASYTRSHPLSERSSFAYRMGFGIGYPYGNSSMIPFEKRFYAGGANGVRGWSARTLGPGAYDARNSVTDFINQCGDISLLLSVEWRQKLFWVFEGAVFADAGNIWTIKNYPNQPGGFFRWKDFYKQIAAAYGLGLRMDFTYFLLRLDLGFKAYNPADNQQHWPIFHPRWGRDATFHFSVGYPF